MTFCVPTTFVCVASNGLYSPDSTCLSAAQWKTTSMSSVGAEQPVAIADVADEEPHVAPRPEPLALVELLGLVATEDPDDVGVRFEDRVHQPRTDGPGPAGDEHAAALH